MSDFVIFADLTYSRDPSAMRNDNNLGHSLSNLNQIPIKGFSMTS
jgi:hypothetical protein